MRAQHRYMTARVTENTTTRTPTFACEHCGLNVAHDLARLHQWAPNGWLWRCPECAAKPA
jgi:hypothetical protein